MAERRELVEAAEQLPVLLGVFAKPRPGVEDDLVGRDARRDELVDAGAQLVAHVAHDVAVLGELVHAVGVPAPVHGDVAARRSRR